MQSGRCHWSYGHGAEYDGRNTNAPGQPMRGRSPQASACSLQHAERRLVMPRLSAGLVMFRIRERTLEVLLAHPGGPYFAKKDDGSRAIPKGEPNATEDLLVTAKREFEEDTRLQPHGPFLPLKPIKQKGGKIVHAWAFEGDCDPAAVRSNTFTMEWPPRSGRQQEFPEIDRAAFFNLAMARTKIKAGQEALLEELETLLISRLR